MNNYRNWKIEKTKLKMGKSNKEIFYRGKFDSKIFNRSIAIVGSRRMTRYGREVIDKFVCEFVANGITTISGFMYGVDTEVHQKTVDYGGKTVAVFGCGLDVVYPPENEKLYGQILETNGLVISQYEPNAKPHLWKFPQRNKIVVSLATMGVLVIEAGLNSGSLVTAEIARKIKKPIFAIPGPVNSPVSAGCNDLIKRGFAKLVTEPRDILKVKSQNSKIHVKNQSFGTSLEHKIYEALSLEPLNLDEISAQTGENIVEIGKTVSLMSIKGILTESGGKYFIY